MIENGSQRVGVGRMFPLISLIVWYSWTSLYIHTGEQYSATEFTRTRADVRNVVAEDLHDVPASVDLMLFHTNSLSDTFSGAGLMLATDPE